MCDYHGLQYSDLISLCVCNSTIVTTLECSKYVISMLNIDVTFYDNNARCDQDKIWKSIVLYDAICAIYR